MKLKNSALMPSVNRAGAKTDPKSKQLKSGIVNEGYEFEKLVPAYFALKLLLDPTVSSFTLDLNPNSFRKFDDLVVTILNTSNIQEHFAVQLKHREVGRDELQAVDEFNRRDSKNKGKSFNISTYQKAYQEETEPVRNMYKFVLYTNVTFFGMEMVSNYQITESYQPFESNLFNVDGIYQFQIAKNNCGFWKQFFLVSSQKNVTDLEVAIIKIFVEEFHSDEQTAICYINFFQRLRNSNYTNTRITRDAVVLNLVRFLASPYNIVTPTKKSDSNIKLIERAVKKFDLTVLDNDSSKMFLETHWKCPPPTEDLTEKARDLKFVFKGENLTTKTSQFVLNLLMERPIFLHVTDDSSKLIQVVASLLPTLELYKVPLVVVGGSLLHQGNIFMSLKDLEDDSDLYQTLKNTLRVSLQGRDSRTIQELQQEGFNLDHLLTPNEIFQLLHGDLLVGKESDKLPDCYIPRTLLKPDVNLKKLKSLSAQNTTVVHCGGSSQKFRHLLQRCSSTSEDSKTSLILTDYEDTDGFYHFKIKNEDTFQWVENRIHLESPSIFDNDLNILSGESGIGKTTLLKYLALKSPLKYWVVTVALQQVFRMNSDLDKVLKHFLVQTQSNDLDERVSDYFLNQKKVIFFFDGVNELNRHTIKDALGVIKKISSRGYKIWVSCTKNLVELVEESLGAVHSYTVEEVDHLDQERYFWNRLKNSGVHEDTILKITQKLFKESKDDILKLPLILYILTNNFSRNKDFTNWEKMVSLHQMYSTFINGQLQHNLEKTGITKLNNINVVVESFKNYQFRGYQNAALQTCLEPDLFRKLNIKMDKTFLKIIQTNGDLLGFVKVNEDDTFTFSHRTFGEYFAAMWFNDNFFELKPEDRCWIFREEYEGIRRFFDAKLAEDCPLHLAVLEQDLTKVKAYADAHCNDVDKGGRTALHLAASMGWKHSFLDEMKIDHIWYKTPNKSPSKSEEILMFLLGFNTVLTPDRLFGWNCFEYADGLLCLDSLEELSKKEELKWEYLRLYQQHVFSLSYYSTTMGYTNLLQLTLKMVNSEVLNEMHQKKPLLHLGVMSHQKSVVKLLISNGFSLSQLDFQKKTPLHEAATSGHLASVKLFLAEGVNLDPEDFLGCTPLHLAAKIGNYDIVKFLVQTGAKIDAVDKQNKTPLLKAAYTGRTEIVKFLVGNGADINAQTIDRMTPLHRAAEMGHYGTVRYLVETGAEIDGKEKYQRTPLHYAAYEGHLDVVEYLLEQGSDISARDEDKNTPRHIAEKKKHQKVVQLLAVAEKKHFSRDSTDVKESDLHKAAQQKNLKRVQELLEGGADIEERNYLGETLLHVAGFEGDFSMVKFLLSKNANTAATSKDGRVPLHLACHGGHLQVVQELLNKGQNSALDNWKLEPIHRAAYKGHKKIVEVLIEAGVDINTTSGEGLTPLHSSAYGGHVDLMEWLLENGADIERKQKKKETCLHVAVQKGWTKCVDFLIQKKRDFIDEVDSLGRTALHLAAQRNSFDLVELLVRAGADVDKVDYCGKTALDVAEDAGREKIVKYLKKYQ